MDYWLCVSVSLCVSVFSRERCNVQMLKASLSEKSGFVINLSFKMTYSHNTMVKTMTWLILSLSLWRCQLVCRMKLASSLWMTSARVTEMMLYLMGTCHLDFCKC